MTTEDTKTPTPAPTEADAIAEAASQSPDTEQPQSGPEASNPPQVAMNSGDTPQPASAPAAASDEKTDDEAATNDAAEQAAAEREALGAERDKLKEQLLRTAADFDNFRKRTRRDLDEARMRGKDDAVRDLLPVIDNLERAVAATTSAQDVASVVEGVRMVLKLFHDTAERMGLNRIESIGKRFDPNLHEAIQQQETAEHTPGTIINEVMPGYMFGKRLIRAAMVVVARAPEKPAPPADEERASEEAQTTAEPEAPSEPDADTDSQQQPGASQPPETKVSSAASPNESASD